MDAPVAQPGLSQAISRTSARTVAAVRGCPGAAPRKDQLRGTRPVRQCSRVRRETIRRS
jgi:hypothetical protein